MFKGKSRNNCIQSSLTEGCLGAGPSLVTKPEVEPDKATSSRSVKGVVTDPVSDVFCKVCSKCPAADK